MTTSPLGSPPGQPVSWTRRRFLTAVGAAGLLAACGDDDGGTGAADDAESDLAVFKVYGGPVFAPGQPVRAPFLLGDTGGPLSAELAPAEVAVTVFDPAGDQIGTEQVIARRGQGLPRPYYAVLRFEARDAGFYDYRIDTGSGIVTSQLQVNEADEVTLTGPGDPLPAVDTPTFDDARGIDPICTATPPCPLHDRTVAELLEAGGPFALLVSTPLYCQIGVCGPILDILVDRVGAYLGLSFTHAEVYVEPERALDEFAPVVRVLGLQHEPVLYTVAADGVVLERLDFIFDGTELDDALERLAAGS